jgi:hypothetical protein
MPGYPAEMLLGSSRGRSSGPVVTPGVWWFAPAGAKRGPFFSHWALTLNEIWETRAVRAQAVSCYWTCGVLHRTRFNFIPATDRVSCLLSRPESLTQIRLIDLNGIREFQQ